MTLPAYVMPTFRSVSELRDALLNSYPDAKDVNEPVVMYPEGREWESYPGWRWVTELVRTRSDWWPALGIAMQHAATDGGRLARTAFADFHQQYPTESIALLRWTEPVARHFPDAMATFRQAKRTLPALVGEQLMQWDATNDEAVLIHIYDGPKGAPVDTSLRTEAELTSALARCAKVGMPCPPEHGPWSWLVTESLAHPWLGPLIPAACAKLGMGMGRENEKEVFATLDWFFDQFDTWRYFDLLESWTRTPPPWWNEPAPKRKPRGWTTRLRWNHDTLGQMAERIFEIAKKQIATRPIVDLVAIYE